jgi:hypothetical protein
MISQPGADRFISRHRFVWLFAVLVFFYVVAPILHQLREAFHPAVLSVAEGILLLALLVGTVVAVSKGRAKRPEWMRAGRGETTLLYFSFATLTTLGYGDIVPTSPISRMLASLEAIAGQLYLAVLVARLVGMHIVYSMDSSG